MIAQPAIPRPQTAPEPCAWRAQDGYLLNGRLWRPSHASAEVGFLYLHGIQSHGGWYEEAGARLAAATGGPVLMPDRRGSGQNQVARGDVADADQWMLDLESHATWLQATFGVKRIGVVGVSWGGKLAAAWAARRRLKPQAPEMCRLLLVTPGVFPAVDVQWWQKVGIGMALLRAPGEHFAIPLNDSSLFTADPAWQAFIDQDPLKLMEVTARFLVESRRLDKGLHKLPDRALRVAATVFLAGDEKIIRNEETRHWAARVFDPAAEVVDFAAARHTLEMSPERERFFNLLADWGTG